LPRPRPDERNPTSVGPTSDRRRQPDLPDDRRRGRRIHAVRLPARAGRRRKPAPWLHRRCTAQPSDQSERRGHAPSSDIDPAAATFDTFADDVVALADQLELARFVVGGISLGAGTALNLAIRYPDRIAALVLCRPAWLDQPQAEFNQHAYSEIADLLDGYQPESAAARYIQTRTYQTVRSISPAAAASLLGQLTRPRAAQNAVILRAFPGSSPTSSIEGWRSVDVPTLVIGHHDDPFHPYEIAEAHADTIPSATLCTVPSKDADPARFAADIQIALHSFLRQL